MPPARASEVVPRALTLATSTDVLAGTLEPVDEALDHRIDSFTYATATLRHGEAVLDPVGA
jgi:hypothetical protein